MSQTEYKYKQEISMPHQHLVSIHLLTREVFKGPNISEILFYTPC